MEIISVSELKEGMVLGVELSLGERQVLSSGTVLDTVLISLITKAGLESVWIDPQANLERWIREKISSVELNKRVYSPGEYVCVQGDESLEFYILVEGELEVILLDPSMVSRCDSRKELLHLIENHGRVIASLNGSMVSFGEMGPLLSLPRTATIRARTRAMVQSIPADRDGFNRTILTHPVLGLKIAVTVARRLHETIQTIERYRFLLTRLGITLGHLQTTFFRIRENLRKKDEKTPDSVFAGALSFFGENTFHPEEIELFFERICPVLECEKELELSLDIFSELEQISLQEGSKIRFFQGNSDHVWILIEGAIRVQWEGSHADFQGRGDVIGLVDALSSLESGFRWVGNSPFEVFVTEDSRFLRTETLNLQKNPEHFSSFILHSSRILSASLRDFHREQTLSVAKIDQVLDRILFKEGGIGFEINRVLEAFGKNQTLFVHCMDEVLELKELSVLMRRDLYAIRECSRSSRCNPYALRFSLEENAVEVESGL